jgi:HPt (histidine-containing phosphotransfer) domain-containing protein
VDWPKLFAALARYAGDGDGTPTPPESDNPPLAPEAAPPSLAPAIETATLDRLRRLQGDTRDLTLKLSEVFVQDTTRRMQDLQDAIHGMDAIAVARIAHAIRGSAANMGAQPMVHICRNLETRAETADLSSAPELLNELQREFARARDALAATPQAS